MYVMVDGTCYTFHSKLVNFIVKVDVLKVDC